MFFLVSTVCYLCEAMTDDIFDNSPGVVNKKEGILFAGIFGIIGLLTVFDIYEDWHEHLPFTHLMAEAAAATIALALAGILTFRTLRSRSAEIGRLIHERRRSEQTAKDYLDRLQQIQQGVSAALTAQMEAWHLTPAEQDVGQLLLKGLSLREIAELRGTSERTIRQQASIIYKKSGLNSRSELSAYFLEDLLTPSDR